MLSNIQAHSSISGGEPSSQSSTGNTAAAAASSPANSGRLDTPDVQQARATNLAPGEIDFRQRQLVMMYTCGQCEVRSAKAFSKMAYTKGVVIVQCPGCGARHLIADHLGWFGTAGTVEEFAQERGQTVVTRLADDTLELTPEDLVGNTAHAAAIASGAGGGGGGS